MKLDDLRNDLRRARERVLTGDTATAVAEIDRALAELTPSRLLSPAEAASLFGIQSDLIVELWCKDGSLACTSVHGGWLVPLAEVERFADSPQVHDMQVSDRLHDASAELGSDEIDEEWLDDLRASRPWTDPWEG